MQTVSSRPFLRLAVIGALVAALGLAGCGRKGPLDPPPGAVSSQAEEPAPRSGLTSPVMVSPLGGGGGSSRSSPSRDTNIGPDGQPLPTGPKRSLPLDVLLN